MLDNPVIQSHDKNSLKCETCHFKVLNFKFQSIVYVVLFFLLRYILFHLKSEIKS